MPDQYNNLFIRGSDFQNYDQSYYKKSIGSNYSKDKSVTLYKDCFSNHTVLTNPNSDTLVFANRKDRYITRDNLSSYFVNKLYIPPTIRQHDDNSEIEYPDFLEIFSERAFDSVEPDGFNIGSNRIKYIAGDVGTGKTAFMRKVYADITRTENDIDPEFDILSIYINLEDHFHNKEDPDPLNPRFSSLLYNSVVTALASKRKKIDLKYFEAINHTSNPTLALKSLVSELFTNEKIRIFIYIDNLDFYHYFHARYSFFEDYYKQQNESIDENIKWLINYFEKEDQLGRLGLNIMIAVREYIFDQIISSYKGSDTEINSSQAIKLDEVDDKIVLRSRLELFKSAIKVISINLPGAAEHLENLLDTFYEKLLNNNKKKSSHLMEVCKLGQHGHRSLVQFVSSLKITHNDIELFDRYLNRQVSALYILYFNNLKIKYSQKEQHFPNLFLNDAIIDPQKGREKAHKSHEHSYWLKYLILKYIGTKEKGRRIKTIIKTFSHIGKYKEHLTRLVLGGLCTADQFRCAEIDTTENIVEADERRVVLTTRGKALTGTRNDIEFGFNFEYLSVIIDDMWTAYPSHIAKNIFDPATNYSHLYFTEHDYPKASIKSVREKSISVIHFLRLLEACFEIEVKQHNILLHKELEPLNIFPDLKKIKTDVLHSIIKVLRSFHNSSIQADADIARIRTLHTNLENDSSLEAFFKAYFSVPIPQVRK